MKSKIKLILVVFAGLLLLVGCGNASSKAGASNEETQTNGETIKIKVASILRTDHLYTRDVVPMWSDMVESELDNVEVEWIGGPEAVPEDNLFSSVQSGIVDVAFFFGSDSRDLVPRSESLRVSPFSPSEEREIGYFDFLAEEYEQAGVTYLGRWLGGFGYHLWSNSEINSLDDFKGLKIRSNPFYLDIINALDATPINTLPGEVYTALERNMVDGFAFPLLGPREDGWTEVTNYFLDEPFAEQAAVILINPDTLSSLSEENQAKLLEVTAEFENEMIEHFKEMNEIELEKIQESDVTILKLPEEESEKFHELVNDVIWKQLEDFLSEEEFEKTKGYLME